MSDQVEFIVRPDGLYQISMVFSQADAKALVQGSYGSRGGFEEKIAYAFAEEYLKRNYDKLVGLIDLDTIKLLATRRLAADVASGKDR